MNTYISLPRRAKAYFRMLYPDDHYVIGSDPEGKFVGSGGAVNYLLKEHPLEEKCIVINAGGESRRLPAYSGYGKILVPIPVFKWSRGQKINQRLLDLQEDYLRRIVYHTSDRVCAVVASGDVLLLLPDQLPAIPDADVVFVATWGDEMVAHKHGVFVIKEGAETEVVKMLQKPTSQELSKWGQEYLYVIDTGTWLLSRKAVQVLRSLGDGYIDLYSYFDLETMKRFGLTSAVYCLDQGRFFHFGTSSDLLESTYQLQNITQNQRSLLSGRSQKHPSLFAQNSLLGQPLLEAEGKEYIWIENAYIPAGWSLTNHHILTGIPKNDLSLKLPPYFCLDILPLKNNTFGVRYYGYHDTFKRGGELFWGNALGDEEDPASLPLYPTIEDISELPRLLESLFSGRLNSEYQGLLSPQDLIEEVEWGQVEKQRQALLLDNLRTMQMHYDRSSFYQSDLLRVSSLLQHEPPTLPLEAPKIIQMHDAALRVERFPSKQLHSPSAILEEILERNSIVSPIVADRNLYDDQIIWARSPVRIDLAGGWSDTPPYCIYEGGSVTNVAINVNGQEPIQVYIRRSNNPYLLLHSIDQGATEIIKDNASLHSYRKLKSPFSIPKAALILCGVSSGPESSWSETVEKIGGGLEITLLSTLPAGSGLGTSSILGATLLGALSQYFGFRWSLSEIGMQTLLLEQMLSSGGGWQDQWGGLFGGVKLLTTSMGVQQRPTLSWLSDQIFHDTSGLHILYYTGITRTAKSILGRIVEQMYLNEHETLENLRYIKSLSLPMSEAISKGDIQNYGLILQKVWEANKLLDSGTSTPEIEFLIGKVKDWLLGYKLPGAGGGGFLYMVAKDLDAANHVRNILKEHTYRSARLVELSLAREGLKVTRS